MERSTQCWSLQMLFVLLVGFHLYAPQSCQAQDEYLESSAIPFESASHCAEVDSCDDSASWTGHALRSGLPSAGDWTAERCISFCSSNATSQGEGLSILKNFYYAFNSTCVDMQEVYICLSACMYSSPAVLEAATITADIVTRTCTDMCSEENGICDRAFSTQGPGSSCAAVCRTSGQCEHYCELSLELHNQELMEIDLPAEADEDLYLSLVHPEENESLYSQGVLRVSSRTNSSLEHYGVVWRVTDEQNGNEYYLSQHLPFLLSSTEVGQLYRAGSNLIAIQQLQCRQGLQLSYALVSQSGRTNFSQPTSQCFFGNGFPRPPSGIHVRYTFREESSDLQIEIVVDNFSPDHDRVTQYGILIVEGGSSLIRRTFFPNRVSQSLEVWWKSHVQFLHLG